MTALLFALFAVSFAAPAIAALLVGLTARTQKGGYIALIIVEMIIGFAVIALHKAVYDLHPNWDGDGLAAMPYVFVTLIGTAFAVAQASDFIDMKD
ncbi:MAG: hypothetical protein WBP14_02080 [Candidatus Saccharimonas aalborgensis]